jgi:ATP-dependent Lhr-like helicase
VVWGRLAPRAAAPDEEPTRGGSVPSRATPMSLVCRADLPWLLTAARGAVAPADPGDGAAADLLACLRERGALFHAELAAATGRLPVEVEEGLWELVSRGLVTADGFESVRALLASRGRGAARGARAGRRRLRRGARGRAGAEGRWALLPPARPAEDPDALAEAVAEQLLARWGVVFRDLLARESTTVTWRELLYSLRRMESRGTIRGGRFVTGFVGEQYALPGAVDALRRTRRMPRTGETVRLSAADPLNLAGIVTPGPRVPALSSRTIVYRDGLPVADAAEPRTARETARSVAP